MTKNTTTDYVILTNIVSKEIHSQLLAAKQGCFLEDVLELVDRAVCNHSHVAATKDLAEAQLLLLAYAYSQNIPLAQLTLDKLATIKPRTGNPS